jgi:hypothetical protein
MSERQLEAAKGLVASVLSALIASKVLTPDLSDTITGIVTAALALYASFRVIPPRNLYDPQRHGSLGGSDDYPPVGGSE